MVEFGRVQENRRWAIVALALLLWGAVWACAQARTDAGAGRALAALAQDDVAATRTALAAGRDVEGEPVVEAIGFDGLMAGAQALVFVDDLNVVILGAQLFARGRDVYRYAPRGPPAV